MRHPDSSIISRDLVRQPMAVAGILVTPDGRYLLQQRDDNPTIWYPGYWGLFGGAIDAGETPSAALQRELAEELEFAPRALIYFTQIAFDLSPLGGGIRLRFFYEVPIEGEAIETMVLHEGKNMRLFTVDEVLCMQNLTPYDSFALRLHLTQTTIRCAPKRGEDI